MPQALAQMALVFGVF